ncbi:Uncharacterised protein [Serratia proteamaculans]|uniref:hypothetical protein n=1 Tax=Serratia proteamaculans TaxID=28151 RepID=UPI002182ABD0|nr:hypothetical protein [Serratia proteamaculans]CAI2418339.1 Uncharacterised protein [Serratia proteamaculans]
MQNFIKIEVLSVSAKTCDRCERRAELNDPEFHEFMTIDRIVGFGSIFGDGNSIHLDICQHCMEIMFGSWIRISQ